MARQHRLTTKILTMLLATAGLLPQSASAGCLSGVNLAGAEFGNAPGVYGKDYAYPSATTISYFAKKGFNAVRLPFLWERLQPDLYKAFDEAERGRLAATVAQLKGVGMTVILDPHNYGRYNDIEIGSDAVPDAAFADLWKRLATEYGNDPAIQFGLMNEPHDIDVTQWLASANAAIAAIRQAGANNLVLVPGTNWTGAHSWQSDDPKQANGTVMLGVVDPASNYAFEVHQYLDSNFSGTHKTCDRADDALTALKDFTDWLRKNDKRGFLGEFGGSANRVCLTGITAMTAFVDANADVWTGWTYWAGGDWWPEDEALNIQPTKKGDRPQLKALQAAGRLPPRKGACPALEKNG